MTPVRWQDRIVSSPEVLRGKPRIRNTRIPAALLLGYLAGGSSYADVLREFPDLEEADLAACLDYARHLADFEVAA